MKKSIVLALILFIAGFMAAQTSNDEAIKKAKQEIEATFGLYPVIFSIVPDYQVPGMWAYFNAANGPQNAIPPKYRELINLAVAAQIPCEYCIYYHREVAKAYGATEDELKETLVSASATRAFSMIMKGSEVDFDQFKMEFQKMMKFMAEQARKK